MNYWQTGLLQLFGVGVATWAYYSLGWVGFLWFSGMYTGFAIGLFGLQIRHDREIPL